MRFFMQQLVGPTGKRPTSMLVRFSVHRARLWFRGRFRPRNYVLHLAFDRIGADEYAMLQAGPLGPARPLAVQDALVQYDVFGTASNYAGFLRPNVGRESNTPVPAVGTHEPGLTSFLARRMTTGTGHGRAGGIDLGGRFENLAGDSLPLSRFTMQVHLRRCVKESQTVRNIRIVWVCRSASIWR